MLQRSSSSTSHQPAEAVTASACKIGLVFHEKVPSRTVQQMGFQGVSCFVSSREMSEDRQRPKHHLNYTGIDPR